MNQPSPTASATPTAPAPAAGVSAIPSYEERIASVNESLDAALAEIGGVQPDPGAKADASAAAGESTDALTAGITVEAPLGAPVPTTDAAPDPEAVKRAEERRERLATIAAKNRDQVDRKAALAAQDKMARDLAAAQARADAAEKAVSGRVDVSQLDEAAFFALAEQKGIKPDNLMAWMQKAITSPEKVAEAAALQATQRQYDPKFEAVTRENAALKARLDALEAREQQHVAAREEHQQTQAFLGMVSQSAARAPLAAKLLTLDPDEFMQTATLAADRVPGMGPEALLDAVEEMLDGDWRKVAQKYATLYGPNPSQPSAPVQPTNRGAAMPKTVSNSLAQGRTALVEEQDFAKLPLEERAAILRRS